MFLMFSSPAANEPSSAAQRLLAGRQPVRVDWKLHQHHKWLRGSGLFEFVHTRPSPWQLPSTPFQKLDGPWQTSHRNPLWVWSLLLYRGWWSAWPGGIKWVMSQMEMLNPYLCGMIYVKNTPFKWCSLLKCAYRELPIIGWETSVCAN